MPRSRHSDSRYTDLFSHPAFVSSLVEHFVHEDFVRELDFSTLKPYKTKLVTRRYLRRECDVIWSVRFRDRTIYLQPTSPTWPIPSLKNVALPRRYWKRWASLPSPCEADCVNAICLARA